MEVVIVPDAGAVGQVAAGAVDRVLAVRPSQPEILAALQTLEGSYGIIPVTGVDDGRLEHGARYRIGRRTGRYRIQPQHRPHQPSRKRSQIVVAGKSAGCVTEACA